MARHIRALVAVALAACGDTGDPAPPPPPPPVAPTPIPLPPTPVPPLPPACPTDEFMYVAWVLDGQPGEHCSEGGGIRAEIDGCTADWCPPLSAAVLSFNIGSYTQCFLPAPYAEIALSVFNTELVVGATGSLVAEDGRSERVYPLAKANDSPPYGEVYLSYNYSGAGECGPAPVEHVFSSGGMWTVIRGGWLGDTVEVEALGVTFPVIDAPALRITRMYWRVSLPDPRPPEPPRPPDGSVIRRDGGV